MTDRTKAPEIKNFVRLRMPECVVTSPTGGVNIHSIETGNAPANFVSVVWHKGRNTTLSQMAYSILPQLMMQGTEKLSGEQIFDRLDFLGAIVTNSFVGNYGSFDLLSLNSFTPEVLDLVSQIVKKPSFPENKFEALKRKLLLQFDVNQTKTGFRANEMLFHLIAGKENPDYRIVRREEIESLTLDDIRHAKENGINHSNIDIIVSGKLSGDLAADISRFAVQIKPERPIEPRTDTIPFKPENPTARHIDMPDSQQSSVALGIPSIKRDHPDYIPLRIAVTALGGYFGSRLMTKIREESGLTYGISAVLAATREGSFIKIESDCDRRFVDKVIRQIKREMEIMTIEPMDHDELARLKSYYMTVIASNLESFKSIGEFYKAKITVGITDDYFDRQQTEIKNMTSEDIMLMAKKYFKTDSAIIVTAGKTK